jgi:hypothetical protein
MDVVMDFYSKPQVGGAMRVGLRRNNYAIPIIRGPREHIGRASAGIAEAVKVAGGGPPIKQFARPVNKSGEATKMTHNDLHQTLSDSATGVIAQSLSSKSPAAKKSNKKKTTKKHKRSKIDDVLGDDSY